MPRKASKTVKDFEVLPQWLFDEDSDEQQNGVPASRRTTASTRVTVSATALAAPGSRVRRSRRNNSKHGKTRKNASGTVLAECRHRRKSHRRSRRRPSSNHYDLQIADIPNLPDFEIPPGEQAPREPRYIRCPNCERIHQEGRDCAEVWAQRCKTYKSILIVLLTLMISGFVDEALVYFGFDFVSYVT